MSEIEHSKSDEIVLYKANTCPAELLIPYDLSLDCNDFLLIVLLKTRFKQSLANMDSPLIATLALLGTLHLLAVFLFAGLHIFFGAPVDYAIAPLIVAPASLLFLTIPVYTTLVLTNLATDSGKNWKSKLYGPSHIGLTDSGFKLWWQGAAYYNYPNLALWSDIFFIDIVKDRSTQDVCLHFIYQSGFGRRTIELPIRGFSNFEDAQLVLEYFAKNVIKEHQSDVFQAASNENFINTLSEIKLLNNAEEMLKIERSELDNL